MTVDELLQRISSRELTEWMLYYSMEPFGHENDWLRSGMIAQTIANSSRDPKKRRKPYGVSDFIPKFLKETAHKQPWQDIMAKAATALGMNKDEQ